MLNNDTSTKTYFRQPDKGFCLSSFDLNATAIAAKGHASSKQSPTKISLKGAMVSDINTTCNTLQHYDFIQLKTIRKRRNKLFITPKQKHHFRKIVHPNYMATLINKYMIIRHTHHHNVKIS